MKVRVRNTKTEARRVKDVGRSFEKVSSEALVSGLGAELIPSEEATPAGSILSLLGLRQEVLVRLKSEGGRPKLSGTSRRQKIPLQDSDWHQLEEVAAALREQNVNATPGQVASMILHVLLRQPRLQPAGGHRTLFVDVDPHGGDKSPPKVPLEEVA